MRNTVLHILLIALVGLAAYSNTFSVPFHFDDYPIIVENPIIRDLDYFAVPSKARGLNLYGSLTSRYAGYLSFALNYAVHGLSVVGYHVVNLLIHIVNSLLVYMIVLLTLKTPAVTYAGSDIKPPAGMIALFAALLFVSHPVQTQAVTYIVQRFASLATMFCLLSFLFYIRWRMASLNAPINEYPSRLSPSASRFTSAFWYLSSLACAVLAMKTKEIAFTLPLLAALYEFIFFTGRIKTRILSLLPLLLTMLIIPAGLLTAGGPLSDIASGVDVAARVQTDIPREDYLFTQFRVIATYLRLLLAPVNQSVLYDYPVFRSFLAPGVLSSFLLLASMIALAVALVRRSRRGSPLLRAAAFGIFWFFLALSVESSIIPIADVIVEHRLYLPSAGFFLAASAMAAIAAEQVRKHWPRAGTLLAPALLLLIALLAASAYARNAIWRDEESLWKDVVSKHPRNARAHCYLGDIYEERGRFDDAIVQYAIAVRLKPDYGEARNNMGSAYLSGGRIDEAISRFRAALTLNPLHSAPDYYSASVNENLGIAYARAGALERAKEHFQTALKYNPNAVRNYYRIGAIHAIRGNADTAEGYFRMARIINPGYVDAHRRQGLVYYENGLFDRARTEFETVLEAAPGDPEAVRLLNLMAVQ